MKLLMLKDETVAPEMVTWNENMTWDEIMDFVKEQEIIHKDEFFLQGQMEEGAERLEILRSIPGFQCNCLRHRSLGKV